MGSTRNGMESDDSDIGSFSLLRRCNQPRIPGPASSIMNPSDSTHLHFSRNPWLSALRSPSAFDATSLKDINISSNAQRFDKVVALVKSCTPNGLGDIILALQDPTDTITATLHQEVATLPEFGKFITAGSVLTLHKVVAFPSSRASCCLNITRKNVVKVISVDSEIHYFPESNRDSTQGSTQECSKNTEMPDNTTSLVSRRTMRFSEDVRLSYSLNDNTTVQKSFERENSTQASSLSSSRDMKNSSYKISKEPILKDLFASGHKSFDCLGKWRDNSSRSTLPGSEIAANCEDVDIDKKRSWQQNGCELERLLRGTNCTTRMTGKCRSPPQMGPVCDDRNTSNITTEKLNEVDRCTPNEAQKHGLQMGINSSPCFVESQTNQELSKPEIPGSAGLKKQRLGLICRTSLQEWTDEQLCVLEMDDD